MESLRVTVPEIWTGQYFGDKKEKNEKQKNNEANWMVGNSAQLDCRTKQQTQFGVSASNGSRDMAWTKSWWKKKEKKEKNERGQSHIASPMGIANNETGSRSPCMPPKSDPPKMKNSTPEKIVAEKNKINE